MHLFAGRAGGSAEWLSLPSLLLPGTAGREQHCRARGEAAGQPHAPPPPCAPLLPVPPAPYAQGSPAEQGMAASPDMAMDSPSCFSSALPAVKLCLLSSCALRYSVRQGQGCALNPTGLGTGMCHVLSPIGTGMCHVLSPAATGRCCAPCVGQVHQNI